MPIPPTPNNPKTAVLLMAHSKRYNPKFLRVSITGAQTNVIKVEDLLPLICLIDSTVLRLIFSICSLKTFAFIAI